MSGYIVALDAVDAEGELALVGSSCSSSCVRNIPQMPVSLDIECLSAAQVKKSMTTTPCEARLRRADAIAVLFDSPSARWRTFRANIDSGRVTGESDS